MIPAEILRKKRDGKKLSQEELRSFILSYLSGDIPNYQMSAFLMAVYFCGMDFDETVSLTDIMLHSGETVDLSHVPGMKIGKHSTGGVGDKISLILAPIVAACGIPVPMISGRGLGHTGGTLDKLESIPGFRTDLSIEEYRTVIDEIGLVMIGQTRTIAPADKELYALRDVTGTVESIPLIAGSIMSKKLAEGSDALVLDVKTGSGAFMPNPDDALQLAKTLVAIGKRYGKKTVGFLTRMDEPLGYAVGNWLEIAESVHCLRGESHPDLMELTYVLAGAMIMLVGKATTIEGGIEIAREVLKSGKAYQKFLELVKRQGGDASVVKNLETYPVSKFSMEVKSPERGYVASMDARGVGLVSCALGAGRTKLEQKVDPKAGIVLKKKVGDSVDIGDPLAILYTDKEEVLLEARDRLKAAVRVAEASPKRVSLIRALVDSEGVREWDRKAEAH
ncbi:MAG: thymidine phosphorylase [Bacteroidota bacterium]